MYIFSFYYFCIVNRKSHRDEGVELIVTVMEAKELIFPVNTTTFDTFVRIYLVPDETEALQTKVQLFFQNFRSKYHHKFTIFRYKFLQTFKNAECPTYNETFCFWLNKKRSRRSLWFHLYHSGNVHTLLGKYDYNFFFLFFHMKKYERKFGKIKQKRLDRLVFFFKFRLLLQVRFFFQLFIYVERT